jgi:hypothetical protein
MTYYYRDPDVIVCIDGNFQHRRWSKVGEDPPILTEAENLLFLSDQELTNAREHVELSRAQSSNGGFRTSSSVPNGALDECRDSHTAAQEQDDDGGGNKFASKGLMAMVCRHDIPLFLCDIKTPGERQFFAIALIQKLDSLLPAQASIGLLYDIACQLDRSIAKVCRATTQTD